MSSLRALTAHLAAQDDDGLRRLLEARPDLVDPPVPDFAALAARASGRASMSRALEGLTQPQIQVLETLHLDTDPDRGISANAAGIAPYLQGATTADVDAILAQLSARAVIYPVIQTDASIPESTLAESAVPDSAVPDSVARGSAGPVSAAPDNRGPVPSAPASYLPVSSLKDVLGAHPLGLGRSYQGLALTHPGAGVWLLAAARLVPALRSAAGISESGTSAPGITTTMLSISDAVDVLSAWVGQARDLAQLLAGAPEGSAALLAKFVSGPIGSVPHAQRHPSQWNDGQENGNQGTSSMDSDAGTPLGWLLAHGLLVPLDAEHVELPAEVSRLLRNGYLVPDFTLTAPAVDVKTTSPALQANAAMGSIAELLRTMTALLSEVDASPVSTLRTGGVGVREVRRLAAALRIDPAATVFALELAAIAGLITLDVDTSRWTARHAGWLQRPRPEQWLWLASAWLDADRAPALAAAAHAGAATGAATHGSALHASAANGGAARGTSPAVNALAAEARRTDAPLLRRTTLALMDQLADEHETESSAPILDAAAILQRFRWEHPRMARRVHKLLPGFLSEAELLGITGAHALTKAGSAVVRQNWDRALELLRNALPEPLEHVLLQADLTAVAPGYLSPELSAELELLADAEGQGPATIFRFSAGSIRRALDAGRSGAAILAFLAKHTATDIPQALEYLVVDSAARHGRLKVGAAASFICSEEPDLLEELLNTEAFAGLGLTQLAPTVLVSTAAPGKLAVALRQAGLAPAVAPGAASPDRTPVVKIARQDAAQTQGVAPFERTAPEDELPDSVGAQIAGWRAKPLWVPSGSEAAPQLILETLGRAARLKSMVELTVVDSNGSTEKLALLPLSVADGRVRTFDPRRDTERVFAIHRIIDVERLP